MKKLLRKNLDELATMLPVIKEASLGLFIGGERGSYYDPYSTYEYDYCYPGGTWPGGYVEGLGYVSPEVGVYSGGSDNSNNYNGGSYSGGSYSGGSDSGDHYDGGSYFGKSFFGDYYIGGSYSGGSYSGDYYNGGSYSGGSISTLDASDFHGFLISDRQGCQRRCVEMLAEDGVTLSGERIAMTSMTSNGRAGNALSSANRGINVINSTLQDGEPIMVGVDYKTAKYNDGLTDHFIVITGYTTSRDANGNSIKTYTFFDPATKFSNVGTSSANTLTVENGRLVGEFRNHDYVVTTVRPNN